MGEWPGAPPLPPGTVLTADDSASDVGVILRLGFLGRQFESERAQWVLWLPVAQGLGVVTYFGLTSEPSPAIVLVVGMPALLLILSGRPYGGLFGLVLLAFAAGLGGAQLRSHWVAAPILPQALWGVWLEGLVVDHERRLSGSRISLENITIEGFGFGGDVRPFRNREVIPQRVPGTDSNLVSSERQVPARIRLTLAERHPIPEVGTQIRVKASIYPPGSPVIPGAYDFQRSAYFGRLGAVGWIHHAPVVLERSNPSGWQGWHIWWERIRQHIAAQVRSQVEFPAAGIATALLTGERSQISAQVFDDFRRAGLAHLLAISGLHLALAAGLPYLLARYLLALWEPVALRYDTKKWAAVIGIITALGYMFLVGAPVPTIRAGVMVALAMTAILLDRQPISMRLVALAASLILLLQPEKLLTASFQLSFGAIIALVAAYESSHRWQCKLRSASNFPQRLGLYLAGIAFATLIATSGTTPFTIANFQQLAIYGMVANLIGIPLTSLWIMPWALLACILMPLGAAAPALYMMGKGTEVLVALASHVARWPYADISLGPLPWYGLSLITIGGLWLCLWRRRWRWWGVLAITLGLMSLTQTRQPDILVDAAGETLAVVGSEGDLLIWSKKRRSFAAQVWRDRYGNGTRTLVWPDDERLSCQSSFCLYRKDPSSVTSAVIVYDKLETCPAARVLIDLSSGSDCQALVVVNRDQLDRRGAHAIYLSDPVIVETVWHMRGHRPWSRYP